MINYQHHDVGWGLDSARKHIERCLRDARAIGGVDESEAVIDPHGTVAAIRAWNIPYDAEPWNQAAFLESAAFALYCREPLLALRASWQARDYLTLLPGEIAVRYQDVWTEVRTRMEAMIGKLTYHAEDTSTAGVWTVEYSWNVDGSRYCATMIVQVSEYPTAAAAGAYAKRTQTDQLGRDVSIGQVLRGEW